MGFCPCGQAIRCRGKCRLLRAIGDVSGRAAAMRSSAIWGKRRHLGDSENMRWPVHQPSAVRRSANRPTPATSATQNSGRGIAALECEQADQHEEIDRHGHDQRGKPLTFVRRRQYPPQKGPDQDTRQQDRNHGMLTGFVGRWRALVGQGVALVAMMPDGSSRPALAATSSIGTARGSISASEKAGSAASR